jgi:hypothetical protein
MNTEFAHADVIHFWFDEISPRMWWAKDDAFDARLPLLGLQAAEIGAMPASACKIGLNR